MVTFEVEAIPPPALSMARAVSVPSPMIRSPGTATMFAGSLRLSSPSSTVVAPEYVLIEPPLYSSVPASVLVTP